MKELDYPFQSEYILKKYKSIKKNFLSRKELFIEKNIAVLGGSTTHDIILMLDLFLLNLGIKANFYESEYGQYWQDAMFENSELQSFRPDIIFIHTSFRNITNLPSVTDSADQIQKKLDEQFLHFERMWKRLVEQYKCPIIQNNFERPIFRLLGNKDIVDFHGQTNFVIRLNQRFYDYAAFTESFFIHDIDYLASVYGLQKWSDPFFWHMYKYALCVPAIPDFSYNLANIIKSIYGKNKKALILDLDNTLWGGVIGDDGVEGIELGPEVPMGQAYSEFQTYLKKHKDLGIILSINSKNNFQNALAGLGHPDSQLTKDDFIVIKANWDNKDQNIVDIANELALSSDSFVFIDDNPAERDLVSARFKNIATPNIDSIEHYIQVIDRCGFFEVTNFTSEDSHRNEMYKANSERSQLEHKFELYDDYLRSLEMKAEIRNFKPIYYQRLSQLTNKSNQFNLTTKRYTESDIDKAATDPNLVCLYGKLEDKFGDNGIVSILIGQKEDSKLHMLLWLMSCRVLKRDMEYAMLDQLVRECTIHGINEIIGYYFPTDKNSMVKDLYKKLGFTNIKKEESGATTWQYDVEKHTPKCQVISINNNLKESII